MALAKSKWSNPAFAKAHWGRRRGRPWSSAEVDRAFMMRCAGEAEAVIATALKRTKASVAQKLGYRSVRA